MTIGTATAAGIIADVDSVMLDEARETFDSFIETRKTLSMIFRNAPTAAARDAAFNGVQALDKGIEDKYGYQVKSSMVWRALAEMPDSKLTVR